MNLPTTDFESDFYAFLVATWNSKNLADPVYRADSVRNADYFLDEFWKSFCIWADEKEKGKTNE